MGLQFDVREGQLGAIAEGAAEAGGDGRSQGGIAHLGEVEADEALRRAQEVAGVAERVQQFALARHQQRSGSEFLEQRRIDRLEQGFAQLDRAAMAGAGRQSGRAFAGLDRAHGEGAARTGAGAAEDAAADVDEFERLALRPHRLAAAQKQKAVLQQAERE